MPIQHSFKAAISVLAELASDQHPGYVRLSAASKLADILSPANPHYGDILNELNADHGDHNERAGVGQTPASQVPSRPTENPCAVYRTDDEEEAESEAADQDDEPP